MAGALASAVQPDAGFTSEPSVKQRSARGPAHCGQHRQAAGVGVQAVKRPQRVLIKHSLFVQEGRMGHSFKGASMPLRHQLPTGTQKGDRCP